MLKDPAMPMPTEIYLITQFDAENTETERLVSAESRAAAMKHVVRLNKASAADVARVMAAGGPVEEAKE